MEVGRLGGSSSPSSILNHGGSVSRRYLANIKRAAESTFHLFWR